MIVARYGREVIDLSLRLDELSKKQFSHGRTVVTIKGSRYLDCSVTSPNLSVSAAGSASR